MALVSFSNYGMDGNYLLLILNMKLVCIIVFGIFGRLLFLTFWALVNGGFITFFCYPILMYLALYRFVVTC
jgi:hypothetical protein